jgi:hypothetical protein
MVNAIDDPDCVIAPPCTVCGTVPIRPANARRASVGEAPTPAVGATKRPVCAVTGYLQISAMVSVAVPDAAEKKTELVEVTGENWRTVN